VPILYETPLNNQDDFGKLYAKYYTMLCVIAFEYTRNKVLAEDMVGEAFLVLWKNRETIVITTSIKNYLIKSVQNICLQHIRREQNKTKTNIDENATFTHISWSNDYPLGRLFEKELAGMIDTAIQSLPEQCRKIFLLSRDDELSYAQIAQTLHISENTVKTQIKTALSRLRLALKDYLISIFFLIF